MYLMQTVSNGRRPGERVMERRVVNSTLAPLEGAPVRQDHHGKLDPYSHGKIDPYQSKIEPYHGKIEPYHGKMEPYHSKMEPYHGKMESYSGRQEPYHGHMASEHARPALVTRPHGHAEQEPVYQNQGNFFQLVTPQKFTARPLNTAPHGGSAFAYKSVQSPNYKNETPPYRVKPVETAPYKAVETPHYKVKAVETPFYKVKPNEPPPFQAVDTPVQKTKPVETPPQSVDGGAPTKEEKKRKWTLGGLFRRRKKAVAGESESSSGDDEPKLGFLARRRSRRDKRKARARGFDVVRADAAVMSADSLQATPPMAVKATASLGGSHDRLRDSSLSLHSSGGSGSLEGLSRRERRSVIMQRAEALRQHGSSSDEGVEGGSLHRVGSTSRKSRYARTERYIKRLSRDEETVLAREALDKQRAGWDSEHASTTSPGASPLIRPRHLATASAPTSSPGSLERRHHQGANLRPLNMGKTQRGHSPLPPSLGPSATYQPVYANYAPRSLSYDNNIHLNVARHDADVHVTCLNTPPEDKVMVVQFPVGRLSHFQARAPTAAPRSAPPPPPPRRYTPVDTRPVSFVHNAGSYSSLLNASPATTTSRVQRPASVTPEDVHPLPGGRHAVVDKKTVFQYFADQNPRSRKPISIQCHAEPTHGPVETEARYMSDSQMSRVASRRSGSQVTDFWRQKDAEAVQAAVIRGSQESLNKARRGRLGDSSSSLGSDVERSPMTAKMRYLQDCLPGDAGVKEATKPVVKMRHSFSNGVDGQAKDAAKNQPPTPPVRRFSRQLSADAVDMTPPGGERKHSTNLEDALDELEAIYKSLKLGDEDLLDRAERRDLPTRFQLRRNDAVDGDVAALASLPGSMSDSGYDLPRRRGPPSRRSLVPDRVSDDMAYRRLHPKERPASQNFATGSFLLTSPALSQSSLDGDPKEADAARDDVVYRSVRHVNNALRVAEPQPPFGIPLGPVSPAPHNDYLHSRPSDRYRPTFKPRRTPDVVNDDLAFRALRKDAAKDAVMGAHEARRPDDSVTGIHEALHYRNKDKDAGNAVSDALHTARLNDTNFSLRKRRAVRSLSANIPSLIGQDKLTLVRHGTVEIGDDGFEKAQSLTHLPDALEIAQKMLEGKEVIGGGTGHLWTTPTPANRNSLAATSTETLTDSRANLTLFQDAVSKRNSWQQKVRVGMPPSGAHESRTLAVEVRVPSEETSERKSPRKFESSVPEVKDVETNDFNALNWEGKGVELVASESKNTEVKNTEAIANTNATARSVDAVNQEAGTKVRELPTSLTWDAATSKVEGLDDSMMTSSCADDDELLTALAHDARVTSEQLELQLAGMERRLDEISDDSLESPCNHPNEHGNDDTAPSHEEVIAAREELAQLHIYESDDAKASAPPLAEDFDVTEEDEEVQEIFHWENSRQFEANNNHAGAGSTSASSAGKGGETSTMTTTSGKWFGKEARSVLMACSYCVACTQQVAGVDWLTSIGIILAIVCLIALLLI